MSMITKYFLVLVAVLCCMQLVEMAPRADTNTPNTDELTKQLGDAFQNFVQVMQKLPENEQFKDLGNNIKGMFEEVAKKVNEGVSEFSKNVKTTK